MARRVESVQDLAEMVREDPALAREIQSHPAETIAELAAPLERDVWIYRIVVGALSLVAVFAIVGAILVAVATSDAQVPDAVVALGSAAVGAIAGLLAPQGGRD
jgi:predicted phage tail protein